MNPSSNQQFFNKETTPPTGSPITSVQQSQGPCKSPSRQKIKAAITLCSAPHSLPGNISILRYSVVPWREPSLTLVIEICMSSMYVSTIQRGKLLILSFSSSIHIMCVELIHQLLRLFYSLRAVIASWIVHYTLNQASPVTLTSAPGTVWHFIARKKEVPQGKKWITKQDPEINA